MCRVLIFGGTTEGRKLAEYCSVKGISAAVSVATGYGAELLPESGCVRRLVGRLDAEEIKKLITALGCEAVIDATHPYAEEATKNINKACSSLEAAHYRLIRSSEEISGCIMAADMDEVVDILNRSDKTVLSTLGSKELAVLTKVRGYGSRLWIRALPAEDIRRRCIELGFSEDKLILEKGPFSFEQNKAHIKMSGARILVTKESGAAGGFPEKTAAAKACGAEVVVLARPVEKGCTFAEITEILDEMR